MACLAIVYSNNGQDTQRTNTILGKELLTHWPMGVIVFFKCDPVSELISRIKLMSTKLFPDEC